MVRYVLEPRALERAGVGGNSRGGRVGGAEVDTGRDQEEEPPRVLDGGVLLTLHTANKAPEPQSCPSHCGTNTAAPRP